VEVRDRDGRAGGELTSHGGSHGDDSSVRQEAHRALSFPHQPFNPFPAPETELRTLPVGVTDPGGEIHDTPGILAVGETQSVSQLMDRLGHDPPPVHLKVRGIAVELRPEPERGDECPSRAGHAEHEVHPPGEEVCIGDAEKGPGRGTGGEVGEQPVCQVLVPFLLVKSWWEWEGREFLHLHLKNTRDILLQPGQGERIHCADGNEGDHYWIHCGSGVIFCRTAARFTK
jgi:hypothetical protein